MSELKAYYPYANRDGFYHKSDVDALLAEKDAEIARLKAENERLKEGKNDYKQFYQDTFKEIESLKASHYAEMVDAGMRERRLRRALYKACANWADVEVFERTVGIDDPNIEASRWALMRNKCLKKVEEYK